MRGTGGARWLRGEELSAPDGHCCVVMDVRLTYLGSVGSQWVPTGGFMRGVLHPRNFTGPIKVRTVGAIALANWVGAWGFTS